MILDFDKARRLAEYTGWEPYEGSWLTTYHDELERQAQRAVQAERERVPGEVLALWDSLDAGDLTHAQVHERLEKMALSDTKRCPICRDHLACGCP